MIEMPLYQQLYEKLQFQKGDHVALIKNGAFSEMINRPSNAFSKTQIFPYISSDDPRIIALKLNVFWEIVQKFEVHEDVTPLPTGMIDSNITKLLSSTSHVVESGVPGVSKQARETYREELDIKLYTEEYRKFFKEGLKILFGHRKSVNIRIPIDSTRGLGTFGRDKQMSVLDLIYAHKAFKDAHTKHDLVSLSRKEGMKIMFKDYGIHNIGTGVSRHQPRTAYIMYGDKKLSFDDIRKIPKVKFLSALSSGALIIGGKPREIFVPLQGVKQANENKKTILLSGKNREAVSFYSPTSKISNVLTKPVVTGMLEEFPESMKVLTFEKQNLKIDNSGLTFATSGDARKYDHSFTIEDFEVLMEVLTELYGPLFSYIVNFARGSGVIYNYQGKVYYNKEIFEELTGTLLSGWSLTSGFGKAKMLLNQSYNHKVTIPILSEFLKWRKLEFGALENNSDDSRDYFPSYGELAAFCDKFYIHNPYLKIEQEKNCFFSGTLLNKTEDNRIYQSAIPSSYVVNTLCREYTYGFMDDYDQEVVGSSPYSTLGLFLKYETAQGVALQTLEILQNEFKKIFHYDLLDYLRKYLLFPIPGITMNDLNEIEKSYLIDPSIARWKLTEEDLEQIRPQLLVQNYMTYSKEVVDFIYEDLRK